MALAAAEQSRVEGAGIRVRDPGSEFGSGSVFGWELGLDPVVGSPNGLNLHLGPELRCGPRIWTLGYLCLAHPRIKRKYIKKNENEIK